MEKRRSIYLATSYVQCDLFTSETRNVFENVMTCTISMKVEMNKNFPVI